MLQRKDIWPGAVPYWLHTEQGALGASEGESQREGEGKDPVDTEGAAATSEGERDLEREREG